MAVDGHMVPAGASEVRLCKAETQVQQRAETAVPTKGSVSDAAHGFSPADSGELQKERRDL